MTIAALNAARVIPASRPKRGASTKSPKLTYDFSGCIPPPHDVGGVHEGFTIEYLITNEGDSGIAWLGIHFALPESEWLVILAKWEHPAGDTMRLYTPEPISLWDLAHCWEESDVEFPAWNKEAAIEWVAGYYIEAEDAYYLTDWSISWTYVLPWGNRYMRVRWSVDESWGQFTAARARLLPGECHFPRPPEVIEPDQKITPRIIGELTELGSQTADWEDFWWRYHIELDTICNICEFRLFYNDAGPITLASWANPVAGQSFTWGNSLSLEEILGIDIDDSKFYCLQFAMLLGISVVGRLTWTSKIPFKPGGEQLIHWTYTIPLFDRVGFGTYVYVPAAAKPHPKPKILRDLSYFLPPGADEIAPDTEFTPRLTIYNDSDSAGEFFLLVIPHGTGFVIPVFSAQIGAYGTYPEENPLGTLTMKELFQREFADVEYVTVEFVVGYVDPEIDWHVRYSETATDRWSIPVLVKKGAAPPPPPPDEEIPWLKYAAVAAPIAIGVVSIATARRR